jgi:hypothetical protein
MIYIYMLYSCHCILYCQVPSFIFYYYYEFYVKKKETSTPFLVSSTHSSIYSAFSLLPVFFLGQAHGLPLPTSSITSWVVAHNINPQYTSSIPPAPPFPFGFDQKPIYKPIAKAKHPFVLNGTAHTTWAHMWVIKAKIYIFLLVTVNIDAKSNDEPYTRRERRSFKKNHTWERHPRHDLFYIFDNLLRTSSGHDYVQTIINNSYIHRPTSGSPPGGKSTRCYNLQWWISTVLHIPISVPGLGRIIKLYP